MNGVIPKRIEIDGPMPFVLQKNESLVWFFKNTHLYLQKTRKEYLGQSSGVSVRVAKGVYFRTSSFRGNPVERVSTEREDVGLMAITSKHVMFSGSRKHLRIPLKKIVVLLPHNDGIGIQTDAASAKPMLFKNQDGWFSYNLLANLVRLD